jgi:hypothetical protein
MRFERLLAAQTFNLKTSSLTSCNSYPTLQSVTAELTAGIEALPLHSSSTNPAVHDPILLLLVGERQNPLPLPGAV